MTRNWKLSPRLDLDLGQRCLFIILASWTFCWLSSFILPTTSLTFIILISALIAAVAKSSIQYLPDGRSVLITGCDTGFGFKLAKDLTQLGFKVFAGCLRKNEGGPGARELESLAKTSNGRLQVLQLDVTKESDWQAVIQHMDKECPEGLWGLINNAGWATFGEVEWVSMDTYRKITEVNVFGLIRGTQLCLPLIRKAKGRVVTITSILARAPVPTRSPYIATKYAVAGFLECLRYEMEGFGVKVCIIEAGNYLAGTSLFNDKIIEDSATEMWNNMSDEVRSAYGEEYFKGRKEIMRTYMKTGLTDLTPVIQAYTNGLLDVYPQKRYQPMNLYFKIRVFIATHLPEIFYDYLYVSYIPRE